MDFDHHRNVTPPKLSTNILMFHLNLFFGTAIIYNFYFMYERGQNLKTTFNMAQYLNTGKLVRLRFAYVGQIGIDKGDTEI